jgi:MCP family monocarboxylic acid transporter-like MFS transporter 10
MISVTFFCAVLTFALDGVTDIAGTVVFCILFGFFSGAYVGLVAPLISSLARTDSEIGSRVGICLFIAGFSALTSSPIAGALLGSSFKWINPIVFAGTGIAASSLSFAISRYFVSKKKPNWKV